MTLPGIESRPTHRSYRCSILRGRSHGHRLALYAADIDGVLAQTDEFGQVHQYSGDCEVSHNYQFYARRKPFNGAVSYIIPDSIQRLM